MSRRTLWIIISACACLMLAVVPSFAHEGREVGEYEVVFGWRNEPAVVGMINGPEVIISLHGEHEAEAGADHAEEANPMADVEVSLQVEVTFGPQTRTIELRPAFGEVGHFIADLIPTRPGDYSFRVFGTIGDVEIDETFNSADGEFSSVEPASDIQFPEADPTIAELQAQIDELKAALEALQGS